MDIVDLKSFLAVVEYRSITLGAKKLYITQSAMSKRIQKLESELNARLFITQGSIINLTEEGKKLVPYARQIVASHQSLIGSIKLGGDEGVNYILIGATVYISHYILPHFVHHFNSSNDAFKIQIKTISEYKLESSLNFGLVDLAFCPAKQVSQKLLQHEHLWRERLELVVASHHKLASDKLISLSTILQYPAVVTEEGTCLREVIEHFFHKNELTFKVGTEVSTVDAVKSFTMKGVGWSCIQERLCDKSLKKITPSDAELALDFHWYCLKKRIDDRNIKQLLASFEQWKKEDKFFI